MKNPLWILDAMTVSGLILLALWLARGAGINDNKSALAYGAGILLVTVGLGARWSETRRSRR